MKEYDFDSRARLFTGFVAVEHIMALILKVILKIHKKMDSLGDNCDNHVFANSIIKSQVTAFFCLALTWIQKPDDGKRIPNDREVVIVNGEHYMGQKRQELQRAKQDQSVPRTPSPVPRL